MLLLLLMLCLYVCHALSPDPTVTSPSGKYRGTTLTSPAGLSYNAFLGIPFALPPTGTLRFAKPIPYPPISGTYDAIHTGPVCIQPLGVDLGAPADENCLYLNVYVPRHNKEGKLKKVLVYIHGGAYFLGSANLQVPGDLVSQNDVIVVTFNYRLSYLGFLKGNCSDYPGNQGFWDQILALKWVKDNIRSFGGDADDVTVGGESAGSESISALSITRQARHLFTKAVLLSGTVFSNLYSINNSDEIVRDFVTNTVGCKSPDLSKRFQCLQSLPARAFVLPVSLSLRTLLISVDGELFPAPIAQLVKNTSYLKEVGFFERDYLVSSVSNEGAIVLHGVFTTGLEPRNVTASQLSQVIPQPVSTSQAMLDFYSGIDLPFLPLYGILGDWIFTIPDLNFLRIFSSQGTSSSHKAYYMMFNYFPTYLPPLLKGFPHAFDLCYLFDLKPRDLLTLYYYLEADSGFQLIDVNMKTRYMRIIKDFMCSGHPGVSLSKDLNITWRPYDGQSENFLEFSDVPAVLQHPINQRKNFWHTLLNDNL
ncbi:pyrethroid hydrolase Ces2a-like [Physella acuta]|uniref:pyrethroid hydrolase Ces2a-like n=1 Tax=Physella acuta TaxID=109671 RepID=UPI0027DC4631|nr:pyrethroid hydrolase Ces2a-like [Physella acuta]